MNSLFSNIFTDVQRNWFYIFGTILVALISTYIILHACYQGDENVKFNEHEQANINTIVDSFKANTSFQKRPQSEKNRAVKYHIRNYVLSRYAVTNPTHKRNFESFLSAYAVSGFHPTFITDYRLRVRSYFWLTEDLLFLEIVFWSLFGVLCSLFYYISEAMAKGEYNVDQKYIHAAKLFYAPVTSLVIYLSLNALISNGEANLNSLRHGLIIFSFVLGFFSGRTIELLNRIKELFFPSKEDKSILPITPPTEAPTEESETVADEATAQQLETVG